MLFNIVVTTYNSGLTVKKTIDSINKLLDIYEKDTFKVLFIDDCSSDNTLATISRFTKFNYEILVNEKNHGNPTKSRNRGINSANGEFIIFFDADDEFIVDGFVEAMNLAKNDKFDIVRSSLIRRENDRDILLNKINMDSSNLLLEIISNSSLTVPSIINIDFLKKNNVKFREDMKYSEDAIFYLEIFTKTKNIGYCNSPFFYYNNLSSSSATGSYNEIGMLNHLKAYELLIDLYSKLGINYIETRGKVAIRVQLEQIHKNKLSDISIDTFGELSKFYSNTNYKFEDELINSLYISIKDFKFDVYRLLLRKTILIAGYDLKFIKPFYEKISEHYNLLVDEWSWHDTTDFDKSKKLLRDADIIFCEWMLGNVEWYTKNKRIDQKLIVRAHRFDLYRENWKRVDFEKVDKFITVSPYYYYYVASTYPIEKYKIVCIPNELRIDKYVKREKINYNIALVGYLPMLKGLDKALKILKEVRENGVDIKLNLYGKDFYEIDWLKDNKDEEKYYLDCLEYIEINNLSNYVVFNGFVDLKRELSKNDIVLSTSDIESFHIGLAEAFAVKSIGFLLNWPGVEYIYSQKLISSSPNEMAQKIIECYTKNEFESYLKIGEQILENYNLTNVEEQLFATLDNRIGAK